MDSIELLNSNYFIIPVIIILSILITVFVAKNTDLLKSPDYNKINKEYKRYYDFNTGRSFYTKKYNDQLDNSGIF